MSAPSVGCMACDWIMAKALMPKFQSVTGGCSGNPALCFHVPRVSEEYMLVVSCISKRNLDYVLQYRSQ